MTFRHSEHKTLSKVFTTKPKTRYHKRKLTTIRERCEDLIELQFPMKEVAYKKLQMDMITKLGLCDRTTITAYLGRAESKFIRRVKQEVWYRRSGARVQKEHMFSETVKSKTGYLEIFGLATMFTNKQNGRAYFKIHYENSNRPYHYHETLEHVPLTLSPSDDDEREDDASKKTSLSHIITVPSSLVSICKGRLSDCKLPTESETEELKGIAKERQEKSREKRERCINGRERNLLQRSCWPHDINRKHSDTKVDFGLLKEEELAILTAKPSKEGEPDKAKIRWDSHE